MVQLQYPAGKVNNILFIW